ncbi:hypothetical protein QQZ08_003672 [Neonectria magnoliae]|uniref:Reticulon domain-containing protein n=1 Tax=Neonectria magnoliae TaxID=2732573 RepID=A0ABR1IAL9_9HYPO
MSGPAYVMPTQANGSQRFEPVAPAPSQSQHEKPRLDDHDGQEEIGPLKKIIAHQDSLYRYISWEDPVRTLGSYVIALGILFGAHYVPLTRLALKAAATALGVISATEFASRLFGPNTFLARLRPEEYKRVPESTLNATLQDIHDFVQYAVVKVQRTIFAQELDKTFAAFIGFTSLYWLIKILPPFGLAVLGLTALYIAPLVTSPRGRQVARDTTARAEELATTASEKGNALAQDGKAQASDMSSKAQQTGIGMKRRIEELAQNGKQTAIDLSTKTGNCDGNAFATDGAGNTASHFSNNTVESTEGMGPVGNADTTHYRNPASDPLQNTGAFNPGLTL